MNIKVRFQIKLNTGNKKSSGIKKDVQMLTLLLIENVKISMI